MTAFVLVSGTLFRSPENRVSKAGKPFATATLLVKDGEDRAFWNVVAFSVSAITELSRLREGEKLSVQGRLQIGEYEKDGEKRVSLGILADHVLALRHPPCESRKAHDAERNDGVPVW
jgi:single-strand DNA-binding protein